jgi:hypothetical protein
VPDIGHYACLCGIKRTWTVRLAELDEAALKVTIRVKSRVCGLRNRFCTAIMFHLGQVDVYPAALNQA